jgi:hypothetical protein
MVGANNPDAGESIPGAYGNSIDLQLAILRYLPTPVVTLDQHRKIIWTNRKADALFGGPSPLQSCNHGVIGKALQELGVKPMSNDSWDTVFDKEQSIRFGASTSQNEGFQGTPGGVEVVFDNPKLNDSEKHYRIGIEVLSADYGYLFILSFEQTLHKERPSSNPVSISPVQDDNGQEGTSQTNSKKRIEPRNIRALKEGIFDSTNTPGFIITADEQFYLANRKVREIIGDMMGGADGCEGAAFREGLQIWDENFVRRLEPDEYPGTRAVRTREPLKNFRCGITHSSTGDRLTMVITCESLYDVDTGEYLGALCWCEQLQDYQEYLLQEQERGLKSHETICNLMPHLVWTTTVDGGADWYSTRVSIRIFYTSQQLELTLHL